MNFLAHALFSGDNEEILVGNMIGDFIKGHISHSEYNETINKGIMIHRNIDEFTDNHMAVHKAKNYFRNDLRLYSGAAVDVCYDFYLANDPKYFSSEKDILNYTLYVYNIIDKHLDYLPIDFQQMYYHMKKDNWLYDIRNVKGLEKALLRLSKRSNFALDGRISYEIAIKHYYELNQTYYEFIDSLDSYINNKLNS